MIVRIVLLVTVIALTACDAPPDAHFCKVQGDNLLQNPNFLERNDRGTLSDWSSTQHAGEPSYTFTAEEGELVITKTGTQPWFLLGQVLKGEPLAGKKLSFSAQLAMDLSHPQTNKVMTPVGGGLVLTARAGSRGNGKVLLRSRLNHEPFLGTSDWQPVQVVIELPANTRSLEVGFLHQADGVLKARKPSLQLVDETELPCALTAGIDIPEVHQSSLR